MIFDKVRSILAEQLDIDEDSITLDSSIIDDLGADSLDIVEMLMVIEQEYDVVIPDEVITSLKTVGDVAAYIENNQ